MQQEAWKKFHFPARLTMSLAQQLYENGLITYHRTDSLNVAESALFEAKEFIKEKYGENFWSFRKFKTKSKGAQEAHEAIRPSYPKKDPGRTEVEKKLNKNQFKLYDLIWRRFIASQMKEALFISSAADISAGNFSFRAAGTTLKFEGFL
jgi:DNA topoisomerase-1